MLAVRKLREASVPVMHGDDIEDALIWVELQITTQLADVMYLLTHELYEKRRINPNRSQTGWTWDPYAAEFRSTYLGHGLHLLEGVIQTLKDQVLAEVPVQPDAARDPNDPEQT